MSRTDLKILVLKVARGLGLFRVARWLTRRRLRILAYHGAELDDETSFRRGLFITREKFRQRLEALSEGGYPVLALGPALDMLKTGSLPDHATVVTIDDGWYGTHVIMAPLLHEFGYPSTLYLSSYYMDAGTQVFNVAADYALWKSSSESVDLSRLSIEPLGRFHLDDANERERCLRKLNEYAASLDTAGDRQNLLAGLCDLLEVDFEKMVRRRVLAYLSPGEAKELAELGMDVQLHTHRHRFADLSEAEAVREIGDNRNSLETVSSGPFVHFCYPSGEYSAEQIAWLRSSGVVSATTTVAGFNTGRTDHMQLSRFLDSERVDAIEFEAEMSGFYEILRGAGLR